MSETEIIKLFENPEVNLYRESNNVYYRRREYEVVRKELQTGKQEVIAVMRLVRTMNGSYWEAKTKKLDILWFQSLLYGNFTDDPYYKEYKKEYEKTQPALKWLKKITDDEIISLSEQPHEFGSDLERLKNRRCE